MAVVVAAAHLVGRASQLLAVLVVANLVPQVKPIPMAPAAGQERNWRAEVQLEFQSRHPHLGVELPLLRQRQVISQVVAVEVVGTAEVLEQIKAAAEVVVLGM